MTAPYKSKIVFMAVCMPVAALLFSLSWGRYPITLLDIWKIIFGFLGEAPIHSAASTIFFTIRLPRTLFVFIAGGTLGLSGVSLQSLFRNPLVSPDIIGVSSGASLGAAIAIVILHTSPAAIQLYAFAGGISAALLVLQLSNSGGQSLIRLIIAGIIVNALTGSCVSIIKYIADPMNDLPALEFWIMGCFNTSTWKKFFLFFPIAAAGSTCIILLRRQLNILSLGDEEAASLGTPVKRMRLLFIITSTILVAAVVSAAGIISWIGLIAPHIIRMLFGNNNEKLVPLSFLCGASLLTIADTFARSLSGSEIPISIITAFIGAPVLGWFMMSKNNDIWVRI